MTFAIFLQHYFPYGGLQRDTLRLAQAAHEQGHAPTLVVSTWEGPKPDALEVIELNTGGASNHAKAARFAKAALLLLKNYQTAIAFSRVPGVPFHFCGDACVRARFLAKRPSWMRCLPRYRHQLASEEAIFGQQSSTHVFFLAENEIKEYQKHYGIDETRCTLLPPWLRPPEKLSRDREDIRIICRAKLDIPKGSPLLLFVGSNFRLKRLTRIIEALPGLDESVHLAVCGDDDRSAAQQVAEKLGVAQRVHFLGSRDDLPVWMTAADLLVHPSERETAGMVLTEALTYGLPVICTEVCGYAPHVAEAGGTLLSAECPAQELQNAINEALPNLSELRARALAWASPSERYQTSTVMLDRICEALP